LSIGTPRGGRSPQPANLETFDAVVKVAFPPTLGFVDSGGSFRKGSLANAMQKHLYIRCFRGANIFDKDRIDFFVEDQNITDGEIVALFRKDAPKALLPHMLPLFARHRWNGSQQVLRECALFFTTSGIAEEAIPIWLNKVFVTAATNMLSDSGLRQITDDDSGYTSQDENYDIAKGRRPWQLVAAGEGASSRRNGDEDVVEKPLNSADIHRRARTDLLAWSQQSPGINLTIMAICGEAMETYLHQLLHLNSAKWTKRNDVRAIDGRGRNYRILVSHLNEFENKCALRMLACLTDAATWDALPFKAHTMENRRLAFKLLARKAGYMLIAVVLPHSMPPYAIFRLLQDSDESDKFVAAIPDCQFCDFSKDHEEVYAGGDLFAFESKLVLSTIADAALSANNRIECGNAYWQREARIKSINVKAEGFVTLNATYLMHRQLICERDLAARMSSSVKLPRKRRRTMNEEKLPQYTGKSNEPKKANPQVQKYNAYWEFCREYLKGNGGVMDSNASKIYRGLRGTPELAKYLQISMAKARAKMEWAAKDAASSERRGQDCNHDAAPAMAMGAQMQVEPGAGRVLPLEDEDASAIVLAASTSLQQRGEFQQLALSRMRDSLTQYGVENQQLSAHRSHLRSLARQCCRHIREEEHNASAQLHAWFESSQQAEASSLHPCSSNSRYIRPGYNGTTICEWCVPALAMAQHVVKNLGAPVDGNPLKRATSTVQPESEDATDDNPASANASAAAPGSALNAAKVRSMLQESWHKRCATHRHEDQRPLKDIKPTKRTASACRHLACCICQDDSKPLGYFRHYFLSVLRKLFYKPRKNTDQVNPFKSMFENSDGVLRLQWGDDGDDFCADRLGGPISNELWLHVSVANQASWSVALLKLVRDADAGNRRAAAVHGHIALRAAPDGVPEELHVGHGLDSDSVYAAWGMDNCPRIFLSCDLTLPCHYSVFALVGGSRQLDEFIPACQEVVKRSPLVRFWPGSMVALQAIKKKRTELAVGIGALPAGDLTAIGGEEDDGCDDFPPRALDPIMDGDPGAIDEGGEHAWFDVMAAEAEEVHPDGGGSESSGTIASEFSEPEEVEDCSQRRITIVSLPPAPPSKDKFRARVTLRLHL
jgi:hypothetical protein